MTDLKISQLPNGGTITAGDTVPVVRAGANYGVTVGTAATQSSETFLQAANNLSDLGNLAEAQANLGLAIGATANILNYGAIGDGESHPLSERYATLAEAQVVYSFADSLTNEIDWCAIQKAVNTGIPNIYIPWVAGGGVYVINKYVTIPYALAGRQGVVRIYGDGSGQGNSAAGPAEFGSTIIRSVSNAGIRCQGTSFNVTPTANNLIKYFRLETIQIVGGWAKYNTSADYPLIDVDAGYELIWNDVVVTDGISHLILMRECMDSRFENVRVTVGGQHNGYSKALTMTSGSTTATVTDTTGLFAGQRIFGTGLNTVSVASITNGTTIVLSTAANFTGTRTVAFEAKAAMHLCSNNTGDATANNLVMNGFRFETCPSTSLRIDGNNIVDIFINDFKSESVFYCLDYNVDITTASAVYIDNKAWVYAGASDYGLMEHAFTTGGTTLSSISSANLFSPTLPNMYFAQTGTLTNGSAAITGLSSTAGFKVGMEITNTGGFPVYVQSIDSGTQVTMTTTATSAMAGTKALTFQYRFNFPVFFVRQFYSGLSVVVYDSEDVRNYALCRVTDYTTTTGAITLHVRSVFGDTSKSITNWKLGVTHPGLVRFGEGAKISRGSFTGGYSGATPVTSQAYIHTFVHVDGADDIECEFDATAGLLNLPKNSWQAQISTSSNTVGTGAKTFTIATGLNATMFAANKAVYISGNTQATASNWMRGTVTSYTSGTGALVVNITQTQGSGTFTNWNIAYDMQSMYLQTGTNSGLSLMERSPTFGTPANYATAVYPVLSDIRAASGSGAVSNFVYFASAALFATITPDPTTVYIVNGVGIYYGSTLMAS